VEVDDAAPLVFSYLGEGDSDLGGKRLTGQPGLSGEGPAQGDGEPSPHFRRGGVEQDGTGVVVAIGAQRLSEARVAAAVPLRACQRVAVWADLAGSAWAAPQESAVFLALNVDRPERRCRRRGEYARMSGDGVGNTLTAAQPGADELVGVRPVDLGAGRTLGGAAGLSRDGEDSARLRGGGGAGGAP